RGLAIDTTTGSALRGISCEDWIVEDCFVFNGRAGACIEFTEDQKNITVRRSVIIGNLYCVRFYSDTVRDDRNQLVENCLLNGSGFGIGVYSRRVGGITVKDCTIPASTGLNVSALTVGQQVDVNNCLIVNARFGMQADDTTQIIENYNTFYGNSTDRSNVNVGANSVTYPPLWTPPILLDGYQFPSWFYELSEWSQVARIAGTGQTAEDLFGNVRPTVAAKKSWGGFQLREGERDTGTKRTGAASIKLADAGDHQIFIPVTNVETTFSIYVNRETDYAGTNPRMIIRQPGVADDVTTDAGASGSFNQLTTTLISCSVSEDVPTTTTNPCPSRATSHTSTSHRAR
ncbi:MAG: right-handed parallel beta-helix repeat-containing protein, partial [Acidobacteria bacterium]|nr:right-handed parallel beta-helix repeat-containing protein [Acidobacteriota bacterium]